MKTSPYFAFYPSDFCNGTLLFSAEEVGAYVRLLSYQWQQGYVPADTNQLARIAGVKAFRLRNVLVKFKVCEDGMLRNPRLEDERGKVEGFRSRQSENARVRWDKKKAVAMPPHDSGIGQTDAKTCQSETETETESKAETEQNHPPSSAPSAPSRPPREVVSENPPAEEQVLDFAGSSTTAIPREAALAWIDARTRDGWKIRKDGHLYEFEDWRADLRSFTRIYLEKRRKGAGNAPGAKAAPPNRPRVTSF